MYIGSLNSLIFFFITKFPSFTLLPLHQQRDKHVLLWLVIKIKTSKKYTEATWSLSVSIYCSVGKTVTRLTSVSIWLVQAKCARLTLVASLTNHQRLTSTVSRLLFTFTRSSHSSINVAYTLCTSLWIALWQTPVPYLTGVAISSCHSVFAVTLSGFWVTWNISIYGAIKKTATWNATSCMASFEIIKSIFTLITLTAFSIVFANALSSNYTWVGSFLSIEKNGLGKYIFNTVEEIKRPLHSAITWRQETSNDEQNWQTWTS